MKRCWADWELEEGSTEEEDENKPDGEIRKLRSVSIKRAVYALPAD